MKKSLLKLTVLLLIIVAYNSNSYAQISAREIMQKVDDQPQGTTKSSKMHMELINKRGKKRIRTMLSYSKDYTKQTKSIMFFQQPADVKGTGFLTWDYDSDDKTDDRWLYLPAMKNTRRISGTSAKKEYFMGSDFTYDDLGNHDIDSEKYNLLSEENLEGHNCWIIESTPVDDEGIYSQKKYWVRKDNFMVAKVEYYDKQNNILKVLEVKQIEKIDGFWTATEMEMVNHQRNHKTIIKIESIVYNESYDDSIFTVNSLEKGYIN